MMHKAWSGIEEVPHCFARSYVKFESHTAKKSSILTQIGRFWTVSSIWISWWIWNDIQIKAWCSIEDVRALLFFGVIHQISRSHGRKIDDLNPIWVRLLGRSQLSNPSDWPCWRSSVKFQGHTALKNIEFDPNWAFPDCNSIFNTPMVTKWCTKLELE